MKKIVRFLFMFLGLFLISGVNTYAEDTDWQEDYDYTLAGSYIRLGKYKGNESDLVVPATATINDQIYITYISGGSSSETRTDWSADRNLHSLSFDPWIVVDTDLSHLFGSCSSLESLDIRYVNTAFVQDMSYMFEGCNNLTDLNLAWLYTYRVTNMSGMFKNCRALTSLNLSGFDTSNVTNMHQMFGNCSSLTSLNISGFNTEKTGRMDYMFARCESLKTLNLSSFATANVTDMEGMFHSCSSLESLDLSGFNTSNVTDMRGMFQGCGSLKELDLSVFDTSSVTDMYCMFCKCSGLTALDLSGFHTANVKNMSSMFKKCRSLKEIDLTAIDFESIEEMDEMFYGCESLGKVVLPHCLSLIGSKAFYNCGELKEITIPESVKIFKEKAFVNTGLNSIKLTNDTVELDDYCIGYDYESGSGYEKVSDFVIYGNDHSSAILYAQANEIEFSCNEHKPVIIPAVEATETSTGLTEGSRCSVCGEILKEQEVVPKLLHKHKPVTIPGKKATVKSTGLTEGSKCSVCGKILKAQKVIPKLAHVHNVINLPAVNPTFKKTGLTAGSKCTICDKVLVKQKVIPKIVLSVKMNNMDTNNSAMLIKINKPVRFSIGSSDKNVKIESIKWKFPKKKQKAYAKYAKLTKDGELTVNKSGNGKEVVVVATINYRYNNSRVMTMSASGMAKDIAGRKLSSTKKKLSLMATDVKIRSIKITKYKKSLKTGQSYTYKAVTVPSYPIKSKYFNWTSSKSSVASANKSSGKVKAKKTGKTNIKCCLNYGGDKFRDSKALTVK